MCCASRLDCIRAASDVDHRLRSAKSASLPPAPSRELLKRATMTMTYVQPHVVNSTGSAKFWAAAVGGPKLGQ